MGRKYLFRDIYLIEQFVFKISLFDIIVMAVIFWYFINYITLVAIGYTLVLIVTIAFLGRLLVYLR